MKTLSKLIIVPWDFSPLAEASLQYATDIASTINGKIELLNVVGKKAEVQAMQEKLNQTLAKLVQQSKVPVTSSVQVGHIYSTISAHAYEHDAALVIMKTAGVQGHQRYFGSRALKIIAGSKVPFIVIQKPPIHPHIRNVVIPIDFRWENKEKINWINFLYDFYKTKIHLFRHHENDKRTQNNVDFAKKTLSMRQIDYKIIQAEGKSNFAIESVEYARQIEADMILILVSNNLSFVDYLLRPKEQYIIANPYKIPTMCINPRNDLRKFAGFR